MLFRFLEIIQLCHHDAIDAVCPISLCGKYSEKTPEVIVSDAELTIAKDEHDYFIMAQLRKRVG